MHKEDWIFFGGMLVLLFAAFFFIRQAGEANNDFRRDCESRHCPGEMSPRVTRDGCVCLVVPR